MTPTPIYVGLSEALSWLAFGHRLNSKALNSELAGASFGMPYADAFERLTTGLESLLTDAHAGKIEMQGRWSASAHSAGITNAVIPAPSLADYRAFDITTDGLRYGRGLLWLPDPKDKPAETRTLGQHYTDVLVKQTDLQKHLKPIGTPHALPTVSKSSLTAWYNSNAAILDGLSEAKVLSDAVQAFPSHHVPRQMVRNVRGARPRGRPKKGP